MLAISRSGTTTEVLDAVAVIGERIPTAAITAVPGSPLAQAAGRAVDAALRRRAVRRPDAVRHGGARPAAGALGIDSAPAVAAAERVLERPLPIDPAAFDRFHFLGRGWTVGLAYEAALKLREAARAWSEAYPAMEYRHGPIAIADSRTLVVPIGELDPDLESDVRATGATLARSRRPSRSPRSSSPTGSRSRLRTPAASTPNPRNLTRSVVLP